MVIEEDWGLMVSFARADGGVICQHYCHSVAFHRQHERLVRCRGHGIKIASIARSKSRRLITPRFLKQESLYSFSCIDLGLIMPCYCRWYSGADIIPSRILVQLLNENMETVDECWLDKGPNKTLDLNKAKWAVEGAAYGVYFDMGSGKFTYLAFVEPTINHIVGSIPLDLAFTPHSRGSISVIALADWDTYMRNLIKANDIFGMNRTWSEKFQMFKHKYISGHTRPDGRPLNPVPWEPRPPSYDETFGLNNDYSRYSCPVCRQHRPFSTGSTGHYFVNEVFPDILRL